MFIKLFELLIIFLIFLFTLTQVIVPIFEEKLPFFWMFKTKRINKAGEMKKAAEKRLIQQANNSLELRLEAWKDINKAYAEALKGARITPEVIIGSSGSGGNALSIVDLLTVKTAKDLAGEIGPK